MEESYGLIVDSSGTSDGKYKPFVSYMEFDRTFEGEIA